MSGFVYFIEVEGSGYVKIGYSGVSPFERLSAMQTGCPEQMFVRGYFRGCRDDERRMHRTFADLRMRGEWFCNVLKLADFMGMLDLFPANAPIGEQQIAECIAETIYGDRYHEGLGVKPVAYHASGDWRPWGDLLLKYDLLVDEPA